MMPLTHEMANITAITSIQHVGLVVMNGIDIFVLCLLILEGLKKTKLTTTSRVFDSSQILEF